MKRFKPKLQAVLEVRRWKEEQLSLELAQLRIRRSREEEELLSLMRLRDACLHELEMLRRGRVDADANCRAEKHLERLAMDIWAQHQLIELLDREIAQKVQELVKASQEREILEKLQQKQYEEYRRTLEREEQTLLDDFASVRYVQQMRQRTPMAH